MRSPTKHGTDRRQTERRASTGAASVSTEEAMTTAAPDGERRVVEQRGVVTTMVDALEDILKWERASERAIRVATEQSTTDPSN